MAGNDSYTKAMQLFEEEIRMGNSAGKSIYDYLKPIALLHSDIYVYTAKKNETVLFKFYLFKFN